MKFGVKKSDSGLLDDENYTILWLLVLTQYQHVTDGRRHGQVACSYVAL